MNRLVLILSLIFTSTLFLAQENKTGLLPITPEQQKFIDKNWPRITGVKPNKLGLDRINSARKAKGLPMVPVIPAVTGQDIESVLSERKLPARTPVLPLPGIPTAVDNSTLAAFPPIGNQGGLGSCTAFSIGHYQMTHEFGLARGWDNKADTSKAFSPKWIYNFINDGADGGSFWSDAYNLLAAHGACTDVSFPYDGSDFRIWPTTAAPWKEAIYFKATPLQLNDASTTNFTTLKNLLANGHVLIYGTMVLSWVYGTIDDDISTAADDTFVGKDIVTSVSGMDGYHSMTIVGYNDDIWFDYNSNGNVDAGEKGALRIANSWGTSWKFEAGFCWVSYGALSTLFYPDDVWALEVPAVYTPKMIAEVTVNHARRNELRLSLGIANTTTTTPVSTWNSVAVAYSGGAFAFDGSSTAVDGTFAFDFTDLCPPSGDSRRYFMGQSDNASGSPSLMKSFKVIDLVNSSEGISVNVPQTVDAGAVYAWVDYPNRIITVTTAGTVQLGQGTTIGVSITAGGEAVATKAFTCSMRKPDSTLYEATGITDALGTATLTISASELTIQGGYVATVSTEGNTGTGQFIVIEQARIGDVTVGPKVFTPSKPPYNVVSFTLKTAPTGTSELRIYSIDGRLIKQSSFNAGDAITWDGKDGSGNVSEQGICVWKITTGGKTHGGTIVLAK